MKAAVVEKTEKLVIKQVPVPEIADDEVLIKVKYTGICGTDWSIYTGKYSADKLPLIPGHEFSGTIAQVGKEGAQPEGRGPGHGGHQHVLRHLLLLPPGAEAHVPRVPPARHPRGRHLRRVREGALRPGAQAA